MRSSLDSQNAAATSRVLSRRAFVGLLGAVASRSSTQPVGLSFGTYAHQMLNWEDSFELIFRTGYDGLELALLPDWPTAPARLTRSDRLRMRGRLSELGLAVPALLENLQAAHATQSHSENLERLRRAIEVGNDVSPGKPPIFETVIGRAPDEWDEFKSQIVEEVGDWARVAADGDTVICFKPHVSDAVNNVERSVWLIEQVASPFLRCTYDYSHLWLAGYELVPSMRALIPHCPYMHLKDAAREDGRHRFLLPGEGTVDYGEFFRELGSLGYSGYANVEVSAQIHRRPDYSPIEATRVCYDNMAAAMERAGVSRP